MKRLHYATAIVLCLSVLFAFMGCGTGNTDDNIPAQNSMFYTANNMEKFIKDWSMVQNGNSDDVLYETSKRRIGVTVTVPKLKTQDYDFFMVEADKETYDFYFVPIGYNSDKFDHATGIVVSISREEGSFSEITREFSLTQNETETYDSYHNVWYLNYSDRTLKIAFPQDKPVERLDEINEYFTFYDQEVLDNVE